MMVIAIKFKSMLNSMHCQRKHKYDEFDNNNNNNDNKIIIMIIK